MLLKHDVLEGIREGRICRVYRRWKRPTVKAGGTLHTAVGLLRIDAVESLTTAELSTTDAKAAGFATLEELRQSLRGRSGDLYCIEVAWAGPDPRIELRRTIPDASELATLKDRLARWDAASKDGPWTRRTLDLIAEHPEVRAADLAEVVGSEKKPFKARVRKLKSLGLTESLKIGYRLSPRGEHVLKSLSADELADE